MAISAQNFRSGAATIATQAILIADHIGGYVRTPAVDSSHPEVIEAVA